MYCEIKLFENLYDEHIYLVVVKYVVFYFISIVIYTFFIYYLYIYIYNLK